MQGLGKPGVHQYYKMGDGTHWMSDTAPADRSRCQLRHHPQPGLERACRCSNVTPKQIIPKTQLHQAILDGIG